jgi:glycosyltransferase involved in cell wall biosynthesis
MTHHASTIPKSPSAPAAPADPLAITFVLPGRNRSGGVRATVEMANRLIEHGHKVRLACQSPSLLSAAGAKEALTRFNLRFRGMVHTDWTRDFKGETVSFKNLARVEFESGEIVIAVGTGTVREVLSLDGDVVKTRYCHGFTPQREEDRQTVWGTFLPTIAVSEKLVPALEGLCAGSVAGVVPNGIDLNQYFVEDRPRDGIGAVYSHHFKKAPEDMAAIFAMAGQRWPHVPRYVFGCDPRPASWPRTIYWRYPSIGKSRELFNRCKVWIVSSRSEGFCLPILEAMACGCAVASTDHDTARGLIEDGRNGLLAPVGDREGILQKAELLLNDETLRRQIVDEGFKTARSFSWDSAVKKMEECLRSIAAGQPDTSARKI